MGVLHQFNSLETGKGLIGYLVLFCAEDMPVTKVLPATSRTTRNHRRITKFSFIALILIVLFPLVVSSLE